MAPWAPGFCCSQSLSQPSPGHPTERYMVISHVGSAPSSWYSVWTPPPQLLGNSQVCSSPQLHGNSQESHAHYKRGCMPPLLSYPLVLTFLISCSPLSLPVSPRVHGWHLLLYSSPSLCLSIINALKPWTASSHQDLMCRSNGAGLRLMSLASNLPWEVSLCFSHGCQPSQLPTNQPKDSPPDN